VDPTKITLIKYLPLPQKKKYVCSFLGHVEYYQSFIQKFSKIVAPLYALLSKDMVLSWTPPCQQTFETLKDKPTITLALCGPN